MSETLDLFPDFPVSETIEKQREFARLRNPVWTENKAHFICQYLYLFVLITRHGTYIDGFSGPQRRDRRDAWTAKLVLEREPHWFRHFHLCEIDRTSFELIDSMVASQPLADSRAQVIRREVRTYHGDFNTEVDTILGSGIEAKEATFCLLDQRTFECDWSTVQKIASHKPTGSHKIEIFYFLAVRWLHRAFSGIRGDRAEKWWGGSDWQKLKAMSQDQIVSEFVDRFRTELGYKWVKAFPIFGRSNGGHVMYQMIHASDHDEAPGLMVRAYNTSLRRTPPETEGVFTWDEASDLTIN